MAHHVSSKVTGSIAAQNTFSLPVDALGEFILILSGASASTVHLQVSLDNGANYYDVDSFVGDGVFKGRLDSGGKVRMGVKTGNYVDAVTYQLKAA